MVTDADVSIREFRSIESAGAEVSQGIADAVRAFESGSDTLKQIKDLKDRALWLVRRVEETERSIRMSLTTDVNSFLSKEEKRKQKAAEGYLRDAAPQLLKACQEAVAELPADSPARSAIRYAILLANGAVR